MKTFKAGVQYNDKKGTVAADRADGTDATKYLSDRGLILDSEFVIGVSMYAGENHGTHTDPVSVTFLVSGLRDQENIPEMIQANNDPVPVKEINIEMTIADFLALFKRFSVTLSTNGLLEGRSYIPV